MIIIKNLNGMINPNKRLYLKMSDFWNRLESEIIYLKDTDM